MQTGAELMRTALRELHLSAFLWSVKTAHLRVAQGNDPWADYRQHATSLRAAMKRLSFKAPTP